MNIKLDVLACAAIPVMGVGVGIAYLSIKFGESLQTVGGLSAVLILGGFVLTFLARSTHYHEWI